jgi:hypothetical protein
MVVTNVVANGLADSIWLCVIVSPSQLKIFEPQAGINYLAV